jgi:exonuclease V gamma subunit
MIHTDEDDEFERIERENNLKGQPYHFEGVYVSASQRNQVLEEAARVADAWSGHHQAIEIAKEIRSLKK